MGEDLIRRLERLPLSRAQLRLIFMGGIGYTFDAMDGAVIAFVLPALVTLWKLTNAQTGILGSALLVGYLIGAFLSGSIGDIIGRRTIILYSLVLYSIASLLSALATNWEVFFIFRVLAGLGTGAQSAIIAPYMSEFIQSKVRGRYIGGLAGFFSFGFVLAAVLGYLIVPTGSLGWRLLIVLTALPIFLLIWWRRSMPESPRWLVVHGRLREAEHVVRQLEQAVEEATGRPLPPVDLSAPVPAVRLREARSFGQNFLGLWSGKTAVMTIMLWILWFAITFSFYGFFTWIPTLLVKSGLTITKSFTYSILIYLAQIPGYYTGAWLNERLGRKYTIVTYLGLGAICAGGMAATHSNAGILFWGFWLSFFMNGTYAGVYAYTPEIYPTEFRTTGMGSASAFGRVGGILAPIIIGLAYAHIGFGGVFTITTLILAIGMLVVALLGLNTKGKTLEQIAVEQLSTSPVN
jgi:putative MFS transporter